MTAMRSIAIIAIPAFLLGFGLGGVSLHVASAQGMFGLKDSVTQIGSSLIQMQKNVDELQKNMNTIKQAKDQLSTLASPGSGVGGVMDSLMNKSKK
jgi:methyl-accepting chemotaxis protein